MKELLEECLLEYLKETEGNNYNQEVAKHFVSTLKKPLKALALKLQEKGVIVPPTRVQAIQASQDYMEEEFLEGAEEYSLEDFPKAFLAGYTFATTIPKQP